ncbi:MAG: hypothetical protein ACKOPN_09045, partial [Prochlorococcaceae cyanobacterium]
MIRYRERALEAFTGPEQLDQPLPLLRPGWWGLLLALLQHQAGVAVGQGLVGEQGVDGGQQQAQHRAQQGGEQGRPQG